MFHLKIPIEKKKAKNIQINTDIKKSKEYLCVRERERWRGESGWS